MPAPIRRGRRRKGSRSARLRAWAALVLREVGHVCPVAGAFRLGCPAAQLIANAIEGDREVGDEQRRRVDIPIPVLPFGTRGRRVVSLEKRAAVKAGSRVLREVRQSTGRKGGAFQTAELWRGGKGGAIGASRRLRRLISGLRSWGYVPGSNAPIR